MLHLYVAFWRPDVLAKMQADQSRGAATCDYVGPTSEMTCDTRVIDCPACRETFLQALPTGTGVKLTWFQYLADQSATQFKTLKDRAAELDAKEAAGWSTSPLPLAAPAPVVWGTHRQDYVQDEQWRTETDTGWKTS